MKPPIVVSSKKSWTTRLRIMLLMPFSCKWNAWVRDSTAWLERVLPRRK